LAQYFQADIYFRKGGATYAHD